MNRDDIISMALEAGILRAGDGWTEPHRWGQTEIERFAALVAAHEREECAKECERMVMYPNAQCESAAHENVWKAAAAIRALGDDDET